MSEEITICLEQTKIIKHLKEKNKTESFEELNLNIDNHNKNSFNLIVLNSVEDLKSISEELKKIYNHLKN